MVSGRIVRAIGQSFATGISIGGSDHYDIFRGVEKKQLWAVASRPELAIALILAAGLIHAGFEDWLFAVGNYLCVFFWSLAFILIDLVPEKQLFRAYSVPLPNSMARLEDLGMVPPVR